MLMLIESALPAGLELSRAIGTAYPAEARLGDTCRFSPRRTAVEIVAGFRPGLDRIVVISDERAPRGARIVTTEEGGNAVIRDGSGRRIVIEGIGLADLQPGDVTIERTI